MLIIIKIKEARENKGMSLKELADLTGIRKQRLSDIENHIIKEDKILFVEMLVIAENLGLSILDLYETKNIELQ